MIVSNGYNVEDKNFKTPVIALTVDTVAGAKMTYIKEVFTGYFVKPFNKEQINTMIHNIESDAKCFEFKKVEEASYYLEKAAMI